MVLEGIKRIQKNLENETDPDVKKDLKAVLSGMSNFYFGLKTKVARERYEESCNGCEFNVKEPIEAMRVSDSIIPEISNRQCSLCGCVLSYKIRQSIKKCQYWK